MANKPMDQDSDIASAIAARDAGRLAEAAALFRPLAENGNVEAQAHLGTLMMHGQHRFATSAEMNAWFAAATEEELAAFTRDLKSDVALALKWLENASSQGMGPASHNLAMAYLGGAGDLAPEERRSKVKDLLAKAREQGFGFFGTSDGEEGYIATLENHAENQGVGMPWVREP